MCADVAICISADVFASALLCLAVYLCRCVLGFLVCVDVFLLITTLSSVGLLLPPYISPKDL